MPSTGKGTDGAEPIRQRVSALDGSDSGSAALRRQRRSISAIVPPSSAASCNRRVSVRPARPTSPTTAASAP